MRYLCFIFLLFFMFSSFSQEEDQLRIYVSIYKTNNPVSINIYSDNPKDSIYIAIEDTFQVMKHGYLTDRTLKELYVRPKHFFTAYSDSFKYSQKLYLFLERRKHFSFLFQSLGKQPKMDLMIGSYEDSKDSMYYHVMIDANKSHNRLVSLIHNSCCESKVRYVLFNWPWQIIPTWRLYNKTNKALKELSEYVPKEK